MNLYLLRPRGFCAGVVRAIKTVEKALQIWGAPIYVKHEIVHNKHVVNALKEKGAIFIEDLTDVPVGEKLIYSAHGVSPDVRELAKKRSNFKRSVWRKSFGLASVKGLFFKKDEYLRNSIICILITSLIKNFIDRLIPRLYHI